MPKYEPPKAPKLGIKPLHGRVDPPMFELRTEAVWGLNPRKRVAYSGALGQIL